MTKKAQKKYGPGGQYYRKKIKAPDGSYVSVYGRTQAELAEKVTLAQNRLAAASDVPARELYVFEYAAGFYARRAPHLSADRQKLYQHQINKVICPVIGSKPMADVTLDDLKDVLATRAHLSRRSQEDTVQILRQIFGGAADSDVIQRDPSRKLAPGGARPEQRQALTEDQQTRLLEAVRGLKVEPMVMLGLYAGLRRGEICGLRWDCVHLDAPTPYLEVRRACRWPDHLRPVVTDELKTPAARREIPIPPQLLAYLKDLRAALPKDAGNRFVYCDEQGRAVSYSTLRRRWEAIRTRSTASGRELGERIRNHNITVTLDFMPTPHVLRHTYVTRLVLSRMDLKRAQYLAGHADPEITLKIYTSLQRAAPEDLAADVWAAFDAGDDDEK